MEYQLLRNALLTEVQQALRYRRHLSWPPPRDATENDGVGVKIEGRVAWFRIREEWQSFANDLWAWKLLAVVSGRCVQQLWIPKLLFLDDQQARNLQVQLRTRIATPEIHTGSRHGAIPVKDVAPLLFCYFRRIRDNKMCKSCRLVCRDWARFCPLGSPERCDWKVEDGSVPQFWIGEEWQILPNKLWAWMFQGLADEWWVDYHRQWYPKLVQPLDASIRCSSASGLFPPLPDLPRPVCLTAGKLPPELFRYICSAADIESWSMREVCHYWNKHCTPRVFEQVDVKGSSQRIRVLWRTIQDPTSPYIRDVKRIVHVPFYYAMNSEVPWIHLLTQICLSARSESVWWLRSASTNPLSNALRTHMQEHDNKAGVVIVGPLAGGHRTIRSVHFALPRSPPRSFSRGIRVVKLFQIHFRRFEDMINLVCELPDLETLGCDNSTFDPLVTEPRPPPRRPRSSFCNKLKKLYVLDCKPFETMAGCTLALLHVYLSVYDTVSFFSEGEILIIVTLLQLLPNPVPHYTTAYYHQDDSGRTLQYRDEDEGSTVLAVRISQDTNHNYNAFTVIIDCRYAKIDLQHPDDWTQLDSQLSGIGVLPQHCQFVFGFRNREDLVHFQEIELPTISQSANRRYSIMRGEMDEEVEEVEEVDEEDKGYENGEALWLGRSPNGRPRTTKGTRTLMNFPSIGRQRKIGWYQLSVDSEQLTGEAEKDLAKVYS